MFITTEFLLSLLNRGLQSCQARLQIAAEMHPQCPSATVGEHLEIPARLGCLDDSERVFLSWNRQFDGVAAGYLQKHSAVWSAFVSLSSGVEKARTEAQTGRHVLLIAHQVPQGCEALFILSIHLDVTEHREVIASLDASEMRFEISQRATCHCWRFSPVPRHFFRR